MAEALPVGRLAAMAEVPGAFDDLAGLEHPLLLVDLDDEAGGDKAGSEEVGRAVASQALAGALSGLPAVVVGTRSRRPDPAPGPPWADVLVDRDDPALERIESTVRTSPRAAVSLALLLRGALSRTLDEGLAAESAVYSMLQAGPEFAGWRAAHPLRPRSGDEGEAIRVHRQGDVLHVTLARPSVHNAFDTRMRDELYEALNLAAAEPALRVVLDGEGPSFCAGGDLEEFGSRPDPATAHLVRLERHVGRLLARLGPRVDVFVHGVCLGSGVELPAFAGRVVARPDAVFGLPEIGLGLVPGAGGTVSLPRRIGRHRTALLALSGDRIDARRALDWGLVDEVAAAEGGDTDPVSPSNGPHRGDFSAPPRS